MNWTEVYNWGVLLGYIIGAVTVIWLLWRGFWPLMKKLEKTAAPAVKILGATIIKIATGFFPAVWQWMIRLPAKEEPKTDDKSVENHRDDSELSIARVIIGLICLIGTCFAFWADYTLLCLAFQVLFMGAGGAMTVELARHSAIVTMVATTFGGVMWRDSALLQASYIQSKWFAKIGGFATFAIAVFCAILAWIRAYYLGGQNPVSALIVAFFTGMLTFLVALLASQVVQDLIFPLGQRVIKGIERLFPILGIVIKAIPAFIAFVVLAIVLIVFALTLVFCLIPTGLLDLRDFFIKWTKEKKKEKEEERKKNTVKEAVKAVFEEMMVKWYNDCHEAIKTGSTLPKRPVLESLLPPEKPDEGRNGDKPVEAEKAMAIVGVDTSVASGIINDRED